MLSKLEVLVRKSLNVKPVNEVKVIEYFSPKPSETRGNIFSPIFRKIKYLKMFYFLVTFSKL